jgi:hypothetical protein
MKLHTKRIRLIRRIALAGCAVALVAPASASAMLPDRGPDRVNVQPAPYTLPSNFRTEVQSSAQQPYTLPSNFRTEVQSSAPAQPPLKGTVALRRTFNPSVQSPAPAATATPAIVHQIETVTSVSDHTASIVLSSLALAIALGTLGYATVRLTRIQRREVRS